MIPECCSYTFRQCLCLKEGRLAGAGLDVMETEPPVESHPLFSLSNVIMAPHPAWYLKETAPDLQTMYAEEAIRIVNGGAPGWCVDPEVLGNG